MDQSLSKLWITVNVKRPELSLFDYEVLALVGNGGAGAHDLLQMARRGRVFAWAGESQYYTAPKRLARLGYLRPARSRDGRGNGPSTS